MAQREHPRYASMEFPEYEFQEYPKMVYPGANDQRKPYVTREGKNRGKPLAGVLVNNEEEEAAALGLVEDGGDDFDPKTNENVTPSGAVGASRMVTPEDKKSALLEEAEVLGVQVDKKWSVARIQDAIDTHKADNADETVV